MANKKGDLETIESISGALSGIIKDIRKDISNTCKLVKKLEGIGDIEELKIDDKTFDRRSQEERFCVAYFVFLVEKYLPDAANVGFVIAYLGLTKRYRLMKTDEQVALFIKRRDSGKLLFGKKKDSDANNGSLVRMANAYCGKLADKIAEDFAERKKLNYLKDVRAQQKRLLAMIDYDFDNFVAGLQTLNYKVYIAMAAIPVALVLVIGLAILIGRTAGNNALPEASISPQADITVLTDDDQLRAKIGRDLDMDKVTNMTLSQLDEAAQSGNPADQYMAGAVYYLYSRYDAAAGYFKLAADQGYVPAQTALSQIYLTGRGVQQDAQMAYSYALLSAEQGDSFGEYLLGYCYHFGVGVDIDTKTAAKWYQLAVDQGVTAAKGNYGLLLLAGDGVSQNTELAYDLIFEAYNDGYTLAAYFITSYYEEKGDIETVVELYRIVGEAGYAHAWVMRGKYYEAGEGIHQDYKEAFRCYENAKNLDDAEGKYHLSRMYLEGRGTKPDVKQGIYWLTKSAEQGYAAAQTQLGYYYFIGKYVDQDIDKSIELWTSAAKQGDEKAVGYLKDYWQVVLGVGSVHETVPKIV